MPSIDVYKRQVYSRRQDFGSKCALSREQQLSVLIAEFMKRRYEFRFNVQTGEAEFRERHSFCFRFQPVDKRALNSIALDAQAEGIPLWDRDISRYVYSNRVQVYNPLEDFLFCYAFPKLFYYFCRKIHGYVRACLLYTSRCV